MKPVTKLEGNLSLIFGVLVTIFSMTGCVTTAPNPDTIQTISSIVTTYVLNTQVTEENRAEITEQIRSIARGVRALADGTTPNPGDVQLAVTAFGGDKTRWTFLATSIKKTYEDFFKRNVNGDTKTAVEILSAVAAGCEAAATLIDEGKN